MDLMQLLMMMSMQGSGGLFGQPAGGPAPQPQPGGGISPMMTLGGVHPNNDLMKAPTIADSAYRDASSWGNVKPSGDIPSDSVMQGAYRVQNPTFMDRMSRGMNGMDPNMRLMMGASGMQNLGRILGGGA